MRGRPRTIKPETELAMKALYEQGYSTQEIGARLGITPSGVRICLLRNGWKLRTRHEAQSIAQPKSAKANYGKTKLGKLGNDKLEQIAQRYVAGESGVDLAREFGMTNTTLLKGLSKYCKIKEPTVASGAVTRTNHFNQNFFETIDTPEKAYWLGFLWADGHIENYYISLILSKNDFEHVKTFRNAVSATNPFKIRESDNTIGLELGSKKMVDDLKRLNFTKRKTYDRLPPPELPKDIRGHFWRGVIDGDGTVYFDRAEISLVGSQQTCDALVGWVNSFCPCTNKVSQCGHWQAWKVAITGAKKCKMMIEKMGYLDDSNVSLERKRLRSKSLISRIMTPPIL